MHEDWFTQDWAEFRDRTLSTVESFDTDPWDFNNRLTAPDIPLVQRINFPMDEVEGLGNIITGKTLGKHFYARTGMPGEKELARLLVAAEAGYAEDAHNYVAASVFPSGMSALSNVVIKLAEGVPRNQRGESCFVTGDTLYYHANLLFDKVLPRLMGIGVDRGDQEKEGDNRRIRVDTTDPNAVEDVLRQNKGKVIAIVYESVTNPLVGYTNTRAVTETAHRFGVPVVVDNTFLTPYLQQPIRMGADIIVQSLTKYINGQGDLLAGGIVGPTDFVRAIRSQQEVTGAVFQTPELIGRVYDRMRSLGTRMDTHVKNAKSLADFLRTQHGHIADVKAPDLGADTRYGSPGAVMCFVMAGESDNARQCNERKFIQYIIDHPRVLHHMVSLGDAEHLVFGETTHGLPKDPKFPAGLVRFAVGREPGVGQVKEFFRKAFEHVYHSD